MYRERVLLLIGIALAPAGCGHDATAPSTSSLLQGTVALSAFQLAVVNFSVNRAGTLSSRVDWNAATNDIDTAIVRARCTVDQVLTGASGCNDAAAIDTDDGFAKPSVLSASAQTGDHTLILFNWGPSAESVSYRLEGFISGGTNPTTTTFRKTDTFPFTLPAGSRASVVVGPVRAGNGPLDVTLNFSGDFTILACVGAQAGCIPVGGRPTTRTFNIPADFPAGPIQASVAFNFNFTQPSGNASGTVSFTYNAF